MASLPIEISKTDDRGAGQETCVHVLAYIQQHFTGVTLKAELMVLSSHQKLDETLLY